MTPEDKQFLLNVHKLGSYLRDLETAPARKRERNNWIVERAELLGIPVQRMGPYDGAIRGLNADCVIIDDVYSVPPPSDWKVHRLVAAVRDEPHVTLTRRRKQYSPCDDLAVPALPGDWTWPGRYQLLQPKNPTFTE
jgi:hypothetical protein